MEFEIASGDKASHASIANRDVRDVRVVITVARSELRRLILERAEITRRIGKIKQTVAGLCKLFGADELSEDLRGLANGKPVVRRPAITQACREVLMDAGGPLTARNVCEQIQQRNLLELPYSKTWLARFPKCSAGSRNTERSAQSLLTTALAPGGGFQALKEAFVPWIPQRTLRLRE